MTKTLLYAGCWLATVLLLQIACSSTRTEQTQPFATSPQRLEALFQEAAAQYGVMMNRLGQANLRQAPLRQDQFPKTYHAAEDRLETSGSDWWCSGFYPGTLLYLYDETGDAQLLSEANRMLQLLEKEQYNTSTHDLGFMMFCSFGYANKLNPTPEYDQILLNSARSLASRFNPQVGAIRSWDSDPNDFLVIIDNMMNLELLFWATRFSGDSSFYQVATTHANTTLQHHFRPDNSSYHVVNYDPATGRVQQKKTAQGSADESAWARGQAWGLYGYTATYRETGDPQYLEQAQNIADFMLHHPNLPADKIPYWDFNAPDIPNALRDASAGAIMAAALLELSQLVNDQEKSQRYFTTAETVIRNLSSPAYKAPQGTNGGFLLMHGVGHKPQGTEVDVPLTYADYYYVEALKRYQDLMASKRQ